MVFCILTIEKVRFLDCKV